MLIKNIEALKIKIYIEIVNCIENQCDLGDLGFLKIQK